MILRMNIKIILMIWLTLASFILAHRPAFGTHPLATDDTGTQGTGGIEIELSHQAIRPAAADSDYLFDSGVSVHIGLMQALDLGLTAFLESSLSGPGGWRSGIAPPVVELKWRFWEDDGSRSSLALRLDYSPKPLSSVSPGGHDLGALLVNCWQVEESSLHLNLGGYARDIGFGGTVGTLYAASAVTIPLAEKVFVTMESTYETSPSDRIHIVNGMGGVVWEIRPGRVLSLGAGPMWEAGGRLGWVATLAYTIALPRGT